MDRQIVQKNNISSQWGSHFIRKNNPYFQAQQKIERLSAAVYLVSGHLSDIDPLKKDLREKTVVLLNDVLSLGHISSANVNSKIVLVIATATDITTLLEIGMIAGIISSGNFNILKKEFENFLHYIESLKREENIGTISMFDQAFFGKSFESGGGNRRAGDLEVRDRKVPGSTKGRFGEAVLDTKGHDKGVYRTTLDTRAASNFVGSSTKEERRSVILTALSDKNNLSIKDFSGLILNCSEKTIQRELAGLVLEGILKRQGRRRWSRYSLAKPVVYPTESPKTSSSEEEVKEK